MKKLLLGLIVVFITLSVYTQEVYIYGEKGEKLYFQMTDSIVQIKFKKNQDFNEKIRVVKKLDSDKDLYLS